MTHTPGNNCRKGSAWHTWQLAGHYWRQANPDASSDDARHAADIFANREPLPDIGINARRRAFLECASATE